MHRGAGACERVYGAAVDELPPHPFAPFVAATWRLVHEMHRRTRTTSNLLEGLPPVELTPYL
jgi:hypothetical protein